MLTRRQLITGAIALALDTRLALADTASHSSSRSVSQPMSPHASNIVLINPGHNKDAQAEGEGCYAAGIGYEYVIATQIARATTAALRTGGVDAYMTRDENEYAAEIKRFIERDEIVKKSFEKFGWSSVSQRELMTQIGLICYAQAIDAGAMVSIHLDNIESEKYTGCGSTVIVSPTASRFSIRLARSIRDAMTLPRSGFKSGGRAGMRRQRVMMLGNSKIPTTVPSCLVECGYVRQLYDIKGETVNITDTRVHDLYALGMAKGIGEYLKRWSS